MIADAPTPTVWVAREAHPRIKRTQVKPSQFFSAAIDDPDWLRPTVGAMQELLALPANWDSYDAPKIDPSIVTAALDFMWTI